MLVKICGLMRREDVLHADACGADYLGFVLSDGFGRSVSPNAAPDLARDTRARRVVVTVDEPPTQAARWAETIGAAVIQLHGSESPESVATLRATGDWSLWKGVHARTADDVVQAVERYGALVDGFLVEGYREGVVGGGGARVEAEPAGIRAAVPEDRAFVLAGGLRADNVREAVARFRPDVVDVSSGVEREKGRKDTAAVRSFIEEARRADASTDHDQQPRPTQ